MDRFMFKLSIGYPGRENELDILRRQYQLRADELQAVIGCEQINDLIREVKQVTCAPCLEEYIVDIVEATRSLPGVRLGVSPRGSIALYRSAQAYAYLQGRDYILPDDIKYLAPFCLGHRLLLLPGNTRSGDSVIEQVLEQVPVPVK